ncbi:MAG: hypothetical protein Q9169_007878 [Polycauliona sp. 2 TL-2023]
MIANVSFCYLVCLLSLLPFPFLDARAISDRDLPDDRASQALSTFSASPNPSDGSRRVIIGRDGLVPGVEVVTAPVGLVPGQWSPFSSRKTKSKYRAATTTPTLRRRQDPFANLVGRGRITWDAIAAITPSVAAAYALTTLFTMLYNAVIDSWSRQPPRETFQIRYGALQVSFYRWDQVIPWAFVADLAKKMRIAVERGLSAFLEITIEFVREAAIVFTITAIGLLFLDLTDGRPSFPTRPPGLLRPWTYEIEE